ncbi:MAG: XRE family transcriptional regulator [Egibacteraceae bacterium]
MRRWTGEDVGVFRNDVLDESRLDFARRVGCSVRSIERWEAGGPVGRQSSRALNDALCKASESARAEFEALQSQPDTVEAVKDSQSGEAAEAGDSTDRRDVLKLAGASAAAPTVASEVLVEAAAEVMEFTGRAGASVGSGVLEQLELVVIDLNQAYLHKPPGQLFSVVRWYRCRVDELIKGPHTLRQGRDLYAYAGWLSELLARLARDLGALTLAETYGVDAWQHGWQAEDDELCAWAMRWKASNALFNHRSEAALSAALKGATHAPARHPVGPLLLAHAARVYARLNRQEDFESALREAMDLHERLPARPPTRFGQDISPDLVPLPDQLVDYAASSYVWLGLAKKGQQYAEHTLQLINAEPAKRRSSSREAIARIDLGLARTTLGSPDEACALGAQALCWEPPVGHPVRVRALELDALLQRRYPDLPKVAAFHERCHLLTRAQPLPTVID